MLITVYCIKQHQHGINTYNCLISLILERTRCSQNGSVGGFVNFQNQSKHPTFGPPTMMILFSVL